MDSLWTVTAAGTDDSSAYIAGMLVIAPGDENYRAFPFLAGWKLLTICRKGRCFSVTGCKIPGRRGCLLA